jgi:hypothetical protein
VSAETVSPETVSPETVSAGTGPPGPDGAAGPAQNAPSRGVVHPDGRAAIDIDGGVRWERLTRAAPGAATALTAFHPGPAVAGQQIGINPPNPGARLGPRRSLAG